MVSQTVLLVIGAILWGINGISHELPIEFGGIYHHLCKDNSITNIVIAVIIFLFFRRLSFHSRLVNKASSYIFAVFALNNSLVKVLVELMDKRGFQGSDKVTGFVMLIVVAFGILVICLMIGMIREFLLGKCDIKIVKEIKSMKWLRFLGL